MLLDIDNICRSCMGKNETMYNVFENGQYLNDSNLQIAQMLMACTSVEISTEDGLPQLLCTSCHSKLINAYDFKQLSEKSDSMLREILKTSKHVSENNSNIKEENIVIQFEPLDANEDDSNDRFETIDLDQISYSEDDGEAKEKKKLKHTCSFCQKTLRTKKGLKIHLRKHSKECKKKCDKCDAEFTRSHHLIKHMQIHETNIKHEINEGNNCDEENTKNEVSVINLLETEIREVSDEFEEVKDNIPEDNKLLSCKYCSKTLTTAAGLKIHMRKHTGSDLATCEICNKSFTKISHLKRHKQTHGIIDESKQEKKVMVCEFCDRMFKYKKSFNHHMQSEHGILDDNDMSLANLAENFKKETEEAGSEVEKNHDNDQNDNNSYEIKLDNLEDPFSEEIKTVRSTKIHVCHVCEAVFSRANHLTRHMTLHRALLIYKCNQCENAFAQQELLDKHVENDHVNKPYACIMCNKQFSRGEHLIRHLKVHETKNGEEEELKCSICEKKFVRIEQLARHTKVVHLLQDKRHVCNECGRAFNRLDNLKTHQRIHTGIKDTSKLHLCIYCGKEFNNSSNMIVHMRRHTGERPYKCNQCGKGFPRSHDLKCHERTHSGEKPYLCTLCGKSFNKSNKLLRHTRVHTGERPYVCSICGRAFTQSNDLSLHMRRHTGARPYACGMCPARFIQSGQLKAHKRSTGHWAETTPDLKGGHRVEPVTPLQVPVPVKFRIKSAAIKEELIKPGASQNNDLDTSFELISGDAKIIEFSETASENVPTESKIEIVPTDIKLKIEKENENGSTSFSHEAYAALQNFQNYM